MIEEFYKQKISFFPENNTYLFFNNGDFSYDNEKYNDLLYAAFNKIRFMTLNSEEEIDEVNDTGFVYFDYIDRYGKTQKIKLIKKLKRHEFQYEIRFDNDSNHTRLTFFTIPKRCIQPYVPSISMGFLLDKVAYKGDSEKFLDELVNDSSVVRKGLRKRNKEHWIM